MCPRISDLFPDLFGFHLPFPIYSYGFMVAVAVLVGARLAIFQFIEAWYNPHRRHSALDYQSPKQYEKNYQTESEKTQLLTIH